MAELRFRWLDWFSLLLVLAVAGGARAWYIWAGTNSGAAPAPLEVQGQYPLLDYPSGWKPEPAMLVENLTTYQWFGSLAPLTEREEKTAHRAPGYFWVSGMVSRWLDEPHVILRWSQAALGALTAACYFFFARRAFRSLAVGFLAGLLVAVHPFYIINTAELTDGVLVTFLLAAGLALGTRGSQEGGAFTSLLFGLAAAGLAMVRAALLPVATLAVLWFLLRCRKIPKGWFGALLAFLGFANGLAPWAVRNFQEFGQPVPVADSALLHLWIGNCRLGTGGPMDETTLRKSIPVEHLPEILAETNQAQRYTLLGRDLLPEIAEDPNGMIQRRLWSGLYFCFGQDWFKKNSFLAKPSSAPPAEHAGLPEWVVELAPVLLSGSLLGMLSLAVIGWRWSYGWRRPARLATIAAVWLPLPYLLGHADFLSGPRLPLDGVLLCFTAFTLVCLLPGFRADLARGGPAFESKSKKDSASGAR